MFVCVCCAVSEAAVLACVAAGAETVEQVIAATGACLGCGSCWDRIEDLLEGLG